MAAQYQNVIQAFFSDGADPAFGEGVRKGVLMTRMPRSLQKLHPIKKLINQRTELLFQTNYCCQSVANRLETMEKVVLKDVQILVFDTM